MNVVWVGIFILSLAVSAFSGVDVVAAAVRGSSSALTVCLSLIAIYAFWCGIFEILTQCGAIERLANFIRPFIRKIYGAVSPKANDYIALNLSANLLGVGGAATPSALMAIEEIERTDNLSNTAQNTIHSGGNFSNTDFPAENTAKNTSGDIFNSTQLPKTSENFSSTNLDSSKTNSATNSTPTNQSSLTAKYDVKFSFLNHFKSFSGDKTDSRQSISKPLAMLFIINATSIQLLPTTVISLRSQFNSLSPADIILPTILCTLLTTLLGILLGSIFFKK